MDEQVVISEAVPGAIRRSLEHSAVLAAELESRAGISFDELLDRGDPDDRAESEVTLGELVTAARHGHRGMEVLRVAASWHRLQPNQKASGAALVQVSRQRGTSRAPKGRRARANHAASRGDPDREPPLTRLQRGRLAISEARRAVLTAAGDRRGCSSCERYLVRDEFRAGRRVCRSCESLARAGRRRRAQTA
jgi:hypothetical protein